MYGGLDSNFKIIFQFNLWGIIEYRRSDMKKGYKDNIEKLMLENESFRHVLYAAKYCQVGFNVFEARRRNQHGSTRGQ